MKNIITISAILITICTLNAQEIIIPIEDGKPSQTNFNDTYYYKDVNNLLNKYIGTWVYDDGVHFFSITFAKILHHDLGDGWIDTKKKSDYLTSQFIYKFNGVEIYNTFDMSLPEYQRSIFMISGSNIIISENYLLMSYTEPSVKVTRSRNAFLKLIYDDTNMLPDGSGVELTWERFRERRRTLFTNAAAVDRTEFQIPANMVLIKQP